MTSKRKLYRSSNRVIFGICQGFADYFDLPVVWIRLGMVITFVLSGFFPIGVIYLVAALIIKQEPKEEIRGYYDEDYYDTDVSARTLSLRRLKNRFDAIETRIRRMENYVTNKSYDWERRFRTGE